jgi:hypothetical protein
MEAAPSTDTTRNSLGPRLIDLSLSNAHWLVGAGLVLSIVAFAYVGLSSRYWADDYCLAYRVADLGLWRAQEAWWQSWTGRFTLIFIVDVLTLAGVEVVPFLAAALLAVFYGALTWTLVQYCRLFYGRSCFVASFFLAGFMLQAYVSITANRLEVIYWLTGAINYTLPLVVFTLFAGLVAWAGVTRLSWRSLLPVAFLLPFFGAGFFEIYMAWQTALIGLGLMLVWCFVRDERRRALAAPLLAGLAGWRPGTPCASPACRGASRCPSPSYMASTTPSASGRRSCCGRSCCWCRLPPLRPPSGCIQARRLRSIRPAGPC